MIKHAEASEVFVHLERSENSIQLLVTDNGKGFVVQNNRNGNGIGLVNMQTRAESLNGTFELESQPGRGCEMKLTLPCLN